MRGSSKHLENDADRWIAVIYIRCNSQMANRSSGGQDGGVWRTKGVEFHEKNTCPTVKHGGGRVLPPGPVAAWGPGTHVTGRGTKQSWRGTSVTAS